MLSVSTLTSPAVSGQSPRLGRVERPLMTDASAHGEATTLSPIAGMPVVARRDDAPGPQKDS